MACRVLPGSRYHLYEGGSRRGHTVVVDAGRRRASGVLPGGDRVARGAGLHHSPALIGRMIHFETAADRLRLVHVIPEARV